MTQTQACVRWILELSQFQSGRRRLHRHTFNCKFTHILIIVFVLEGVSGAGGVESVRRRRKRRKV